MTKQMASDINSPISVLVADDDKVIAEILHDLIAGPERTVVVCHDGQQAIEQIKKNRFDLIVTDMVMPGQDGLAVLKFARQMHPEVIVIILTGYASLESAVSAIKEGAYDYIRKPCKLEEIRIVIERATEKIKLFKENRDLLDKLQQAHRELMVCGQKKEAGKNNITSLNFFSSNMAGLHFLYNHPSRSNCIDKLEVLSHLKENGSLTEDEFRSFKNHYLKMIQAPE